MVSDLLLEIGVEELPAQDVWAAITQLQEKTPHLLSQQGLKAEQINVWGTPRRLVVYLHKVSSRNRVGPQTWSNLATSLIKSLEFAKSMRWLPKNPLRFSRPIRWLVLMLNTQPIRLVFAQVKAAPLSFGPRFRLSAQFKVSSVNNYFQQIKQYNIILDQNQRRKLILRQSHKLAKQVKGKPLLNPKLVNEVVQLVEYPTCILGKFERRFLKIPSPVVITVMQQHQRYFALVNAQNKLLPYFITVANQLPKHTTLIKQGNEKVIHARLSDGEFFYQQDRQHNLAHFVTKLKNITFHEKLGTVYAKSERLEILAPQIAELLGFTQQQTQNLKRAAHLCKADLATALVTEFPSLQGEIGQIYARLDGEKPSVAKAIFEHYLPRFSGDSLPQTKLGQVLSLSDKLDTLSSFFAVGIRPKGSQDPYALRRAALGLIQVLASFKPHLARKLTLSELVRLSQSCLPTKLSSASQQELLAFLRERIRANLKEQNVPNDVILATLNGPQAENIGVVYKLTEVLSQAKAKSQLKGFVQAAKRTHNILAQNQIQLVRRIQPEPKLFEKEAERKLYQKYLEGQKSLPRLIAQAKFKEILRFYTSLANLVDEFFAAVLVITPDVKQKNNRLLLLKEVFDLFNLLFNPIELRA